MKENELRKLVREVAEETKGNIVVADFAVAVAKKALAIEREACAKVCESISEYHGYVSCQDDGAQFSEGYKSDGALECSAEIRARYSDVTGLAPEGDKS